MSAIEKMRIKVRKSNMRYIFTIFIAVILFLPSISLADAEKIFKENSKAVVVVV